MKPLIYTSDSLSKTHRIHFNASVDHSHMFSVHLTEVEAIEAGIALIKQAEALTAPARAEARAVDVFAGVLALFARWRVPTAVAEAA